MLQQGDLSWHAVGSDGLVAQADGIELWINRSRNGALALPDPQASADVLWSTEEATSAGAIGEQSAALLLTTPK